MKKTLCVLAAAILALSLTACRGNQDQPLPENVQDVGGVIVKEDDLLEPSDIDMTETQDQTSGVILGDNANLAEVTVDMVKGWLAEEVSGEYESIPDEDFLTERAKLDGGGEVEVCSYFEHYYCTNFLLPAETTTDGERFAELLALYIGRPLIDEETQELNDAVTSVRNGAESIYLQTIQESALVYVMLRDDFILVQAA